MTEILYFFVCGIFYSSLCKTYAENSTMKIYVQEKEITILFPENFTLLFDADSSSPGGIAWIKSIHGGVVKTLEQSVDLNLPPPWNVTLIPEHLGHDTVYLDFNRTNVDVRNAFVIVTVKYSSVLESVSAVIGWIYFVAWSISFYPQIFQNWRRKSVVGFSFDFAILNILGFFMYCLFNSGLYWNKTVQADYFAAHPRGLNPVLLNDVLFSTHALLLTVLVGCQCLFYERGGQRVSKPTLSIIGAILLIFGVSLVLPFFQIINWLHFLTICSYIKLSITLMKYVPQAFLNYKRKSTVGWSIENVILDFLGGTFSMMQMIINAYNYDDWTSIFGDPTKFGLGLFSVLFDMLFLFQHYCLYRVNDVRRVVGDIPEDIRHNFAQRNQQNTEAPLLSSKMI